ncbi:hypothetical protein OKW28_000901 [Paraburkholderia sp. 40]
MRFNFPLLPAESGIPDSRWSDAGMTTFRASEPGYRSSPDAVRVPLQKIEPPFRNPEVMRDWRGFDRTRMVDVLSGLATGAKMPPVPFVALPSADYPAAPFAYRVCDGFHRFYASVAAAFAMVRRRALAAGIGTVIGNHTFRATGITAYLKNGGTLENAAAMANHASTHHATLRPPP